MTSTISCRTCKNNAPTTSSLPIVTRGKHEDTASPPPPHADTARRRRPPHATVRHRTLLHAPPHTAVFAAAAPSLFAARCLHRCSLHVSSAVVCCTLPHAATHPSACRRHLRCRPSVVCCVSSLPSFAALRRGGGEQPAAIVLL